MFSASSKISVNPESAFGQDQEQGAVPGQGATIESIMESSTKFKKMETKFAMICTKYSVAELEQAIADIRSSCNISSTGTRGIEGGLVLASFSVEAISGSVKVSLLSVGAPSLMGHHLCNYKSNQAPDAVPNQAPGVVPNQATGAVPYQATGAVPNQDHKPVPNQNTGSVHVQDPSRMPSQDPSSEPNQEPSSVPNQDHGSVPNLATGAVHDQDASWVPNQDPSSALNQEPSLLPYQDHSSVPNQDISLGHVDMDKGHVGQCHVVDIASDKNAERIYRLIADAEQFLWGGSCMDEVRVLEQQLQRAKPPLPLDGPDAEAYRQELEEALLETRGLNSLLLPSYLEADGEEVHVIDGDEAGFEGEGEEEGDEGGCDGEGGGEGGGSQEDNALAISVGARSGPSQAKATAAGGSNRSVPWPSQAKAAAAGGAGRAVSGPSQSRATVAGGAGGAVSGQGVRGERRQTSRTRAPSGGSVAIPYGEGKNDVDSNMVESARGDVEGEEEEEGSILELPAPLPVPAEDATGVDVPSIGLDGGTVGASDWEAAYKRVVLSGDRMHLVHLEQLSAKALHLRKKLVAEVEDVNERLEVAQDFRKQVRSFLLGSDDEKAELVEVPTVPTMRKAELVEVKALQSSLVQCRIILPESPALAVAVEAVDCVQKLSMEYLRTRQPMGRLVKVVKAAERQPAVFPEAKQPMRRLIEVVKAAEHQPAVLPEAKQVEQLIKRAKEWLVKAKEASQAGAPLRNMRLLLHSGERMGVEMPELKQLHGTIRRCGKAVQNGERMGVEMLELEQLHCTIRRCEWEGSAKGERMGVEMPELEQLRGTIRRREWEDSAKRAFTSKASLQSVTDILSDAIPMGATGTVAFAKLKEKVVVIQAWDARVTQCFVFFPFSPSFVIDVTGTVALAKLKEKVVVIQAWDARGTLSDAIPIGATCTAAFAKLKEKVVVIQAWEARGTQVLAEVAARATAASFSAPDVVLGGGSAGGDVAAEQASRLGFMGSSVLQEIQLEVFQSLWMRGRVWCTAQHHKGAAAVGRLRLWAREAKFGVRLEHLQQVQQLAKFGVRLEHLQQAQQLVRRAQAWVRETVEYVDKREAVGGRPLLGSDLPEASATANAPRAKAEVALPEAAVKEAKPPAVAVTQDAGGWNEFVRNSFPTVFSTNPKPSTSDKVDHSSITLASGLPLSRRTSDLGSGDGLVLSERPAEILGRKRDRKRRATTSALGQAPAGADVGSEDLSCSLATVHKMMPLLEVIVSKPMLASAVAALAKCDHASVDPATKAALKDAVQEAEAYRTTLLSFIPPVTSKGSASAPMQRITLDEAVALLNKGAEAALQEATVGSLIISSTILSPLTAGATEATMGSLIIRSTNLSPLTAGATEATMGSLIIRSTNLSLLTAEATEATVGSLIMSSTNLSPLTVRVQAAESWVDSLRKTVVKRGSAFKADRCLDAISSSLASAVEVLLALFADGNKASLEDADGEDDAGRFCVCQQGYDASTSMLQCDSCQDWYHIKCAKTIKKWECPICLAAKGDEEELEAAIERVHKSRCPSIDELQEVGKTCLAFNLGLPEAEELTLAIKNFATWMDLCTRLFDGHQLALGPLPGSAPPDSGRKTEGAGGVEGKEAGTPRGPLGGGKEGGPSPSQAGATKGSAEKKASGRSPGSASADRKKAGKDSSLGDRLFLKAPLSTKTLRKIVQMTASVEVEESVELCDHAVGLLRYMLWRNKASKLVLVSGHPNRPHLDALVKLAQEASALELDLENDSVGRSITKHINTGQEWVQRSKEMLEKLKVAAGKQMMDEETEALLRKCQKLKVAAGKALLDEETEALLRKCQGMMVEEARMGVRIDKAFDTLASASRLYCLCERLHNEVIPMAMVPYPSAASLPLDFKEQLDAWTDEKARSELQKAALAQKQEEAPPGLSSHGHALPAHLMHHYSMLNVNMPPSSGMYPANMSEALASQMMGIQGAHQMMGPMVPHGPHMPANVPEGDSRGHSARSRSGAQEAEGEERADGRRKRRRTTKDSDNSDAYAPPSGLSPTHEEVGGMDGAHLNSIDQQLRQMVGRMQAATVHEQRQRMLQQFQQGVARNSGEAGGSDDHPVIPPSHAPGISWGLGMGEAPDMGVLGPGSVLPGMGAAPDMGVLGPGSVLSGIPPFPPGILMPQHMGGWGLGQFGGYGGHPALGGGHIADPHVGQLGLPPAGVGGRAHGGGGGGGYGGARGGGPPSGGSTGGAADTSGAAPLRTSRRRSSSGR
eukprot:gene28334-31454_t